MRRTRPFLALAALALLIGGCSAPVPRLDTDQPLAVKWRLPLQVPSPPPGHTWTFIDQRNDLMGEGAGLARIDPRLGIGLWSLQLPDTYTLTATHGAHSVLVTSTNDEVLLLGGGPGPGGGDVTSVEAVSMQTGEILWQRQLPSPSQVLDGDGTVLVARCLAGNCSLTGYAGDDGRQRWSRRVTGTSVATSPGQSTAYVAGRRTVTMVDTRLGEVRWTIARPPGTNLRMVPSNSELTLFVPPTSAAACTALLEFVDNTGKVVAKDEAKWHDEGALGRPCTYDPDRLFLSANRIEVPVAGAAEVVDVYSGKVFSFALDPGEYLLCNCPDELTWTAGVGYRSRGMPYLRLKTPTVPSPDGQPAAEVNDGDDAWLLRAGTGLVLWAPVYHEVKWRSPTVVPVLHHGGTLVYQDGSALVGLAAQDTSKP